MSEAEVKKPIAVAVYMSCDDIYAHQLYTAEEIQQVRDGSHPEIPEDEKVIVVHGNLETEFFT